MSLMPVEEARRRVLETACRPLDTQVIAIEQALGRVLARDVRARITQPPFAASAMDGYAVRAADVAEVPADLTVIGEAPAGHAYGGAVGPGQAVRIFTGAPVPEGADAIVIQEDADKVSDDRVRVRESSDAGRHIRPSGLDFSRGDALIAAGRRLIPRQIALAAAMNVAEITVYRRPSVAVLATGDELVLPGSTPRPDQIVSSNSFGLRTLVTKFGGEAVDLGIARDDIESLREAAARARGCDILVTLGGASVGDHDLVRGALGQAGLEVDFWRIAMRPGKPLMFGRMGDVRVLGLPGNPVSAFVCARLFLKPLLDTLCGLSGEDGRSVTARLAMDIAANDRRQDYLRAKLTHDGSGMPVAEPFPRQDSSMLRTLTEADGLIVRPPHAPAAGAGDMVDVLLLDF